MTPDPMPRSVHETPVHVSKGSEAGLPALYSLLQTARLEICPDGEAAADWLNTPGHHADVVLYDITPHAASNGHHQSHIHVEDMARFIRMTRTQPSLRVLPIIALGDAPEPRDSEPSDAGTEVIETEHTGTKSTRTERTGTERTGTERTGAPDRQPEIRQPGQESRQSPNQPSYRRRQELTHRGRAARSASSPAQHIGRAALYAGAIDYLSYSVNPVIFMHTIETAPMRQRAIAAEVQRQVEERYHDIIGIIQHEFRTPMTLLLGYGEYLRDALDEKLDKEELKLSVEAMLSGSHRLNRLIESFLFLSELQYRRPEQIQVQRVMPEMLWREVQAILRNEAQESPVSIVHAFPAETSAVEVDPELVREALTRLLDNALHYTRAESREVRLEVETSDQWVRWIIEDEGTGIEADQLQHILEPFGRGEGKRFMPRSAGLSLAIVKRIAELHGGTLSVASRLHEGSRFVLQLPREHTES